MAIAPLGPGVLPIAGAPGIGSVHPTKPADVSFAKAMSQVLGDVNAQQTQSDQAIRQLAMGQANNLHDVMLSVAKADLSFRMVLEVRNRLTEAYQEIMRMQI